MPNRRHLWLIRHAESPAHSSSGLDVDRVLSERGLADCASLAHWFAGSDACDWLLASSAVRTVMTSQALAKALGVPGDHQVHDPRLYEASEAVMLDALQTLPLEADRAVIIGHNPTISTVVSRLLGARAGVHMPPLGCVGLFGPSDWLHWQYGQCSASASWAPDQGPLLKDSSADSQASNLGHSP